MIGFIVSILLATITLAAISLHKTYSQLPLKEIKRRAQKGDELAGIMYRATSYGLSLTLLLWLVIGASGTALFFVMARWLPRPLAIVGIISIIWFGFAWLPNSRVSALGLQIVRVVTPPLAWLLNYLHPVLDRMGLMVTHRLGGRLHTRLYQREDLVDLLQNQQAQEDNRMTKEELDIAIHALTFGDRLIRDVLVPRSHVKMVQTSDAIGPVLMDELHASGHSRFPVYRETPDALVGVLYLRDLIAQKHAKTVEDAMHTSVQYVHEEQTLLDALQAFLKTKRHLFVVVNSFEEMVGIITVEDVLEQVIGQHIVDEFDQYDDIRAVAHRTAVKIHKEQKHDGPLPSEEPEVIQ